MVDAAEFLIAVAQREGVRSVALYLEDDGDVRALARGAGAVRASRRPRGRAGRRARRARAAPRPRPTPARWPATSASSAPLFEECGAAWVENPHELLEVAKALARPRAPARGARRARPRRRGDLSPAAGAAPPGAATRGGAGGRAAPGWAVAVMTCSGGDSAVAADLAAKLGVDLLALAPATVAALERHLPAAATAGNPLDYTALLWDDVDALTALIEALGDDPEVGRVLVLFDAYDGPAPILDAAARAAAPTLVASTIPELMPEGGVAGLRERAARGEDARDHARPRADRRARTARRPRNAHRGARRQGDPARGGRARPGRTRRHRRRRRGRARPRASASSR